MSPAATSPRVYVRGPHPAGAGDELDRVDLEAERRAQLGERLGVAGGPVAEAEVLPDDDLDRVQPVREHLPGELLRGQRGQLAA